MIFLTPVNKLIKVTLYINELDEMSWQWRLISAADVQRGLFLCYLQNSEKDDFSITQLQVHWNNLQTYLATKISVFEVQRYKLTVHRCGLRSCIVNAECGKTLSFSPLSLRAVRKT